MLALPPFFITPLLLTVLYFLACSRVRGFRNVPKHIVYKGSVRSPLVQREVKLQAWFAQYPRAVPRVADTSFFLPWEEGSPATFKTEDSHLPQSAVLFSEVI